MSRTGLNTAIAIASGSGAGAIIRNGVIVGKWETSGTLDTARTSASAAKTLTAMQAYAFARQTSLITGDEAAQGIYSAVPSATVTIKELMSMAGGYNHNGTVCGAGSITYTEGSDWAYSNASIHYGQHTVAKKVGDTNDETIQEFLDRLLYDRVGASGITWNADDVTPISTSNGDKAALPAAIDMNVSIDQAARIALLWCRGGVWNGQTLLSSAVVTECTSVTGGSLTHQFPSSYVYNSIDPPDFYGYGCWLRPNAGLMASVPSDFVCACGAFSGVNEFVCGWSPSKDVLIVRAGNSLRESPYTSHWYDGNDALFQAVFNAIERDF